MNNLFMPEARDALTEIAADCYRQYLPFNEAWFIVSAFGALIDPKHYAAPSWEIVMAVYRPQGHWN